MKRTKNINSPAGAVKQVKQRTCIACRRVRDKGDLLRLVRTPAGSIEIDPRGRKEGRGAYLCRDLACWVNGLKGDRLEHALRGRLTVQEREAIAREAEGLLKGNRE